QGGSIRAADRHRRRRALRGPDSNDARDAERARGHRASVAGTRADPAAPVHRGRAAVGRARHPRAGGSRQATAASQDAGMISPGAARERLLELLRSLSYERREVVLASGKRSDFYIDCKQAVLTAEGHFLVGT